MKGLNTFTKSQADEIKELISVKVQVSPDKQKGIRRKIRKLRFYYSDFSSKKDGYTVSDFESLILSRQVKIVDKPKTSMDLATILQTFKKNRFDPTRDSEIIIPSSSGNYILCLRTKSNLPIVSVKPILTTFDKLKVIYTGIAGSSLRSRDYRQHFGNNAGRSTLRKSLGVMFGYEQILRDKNATNGKTKFSNTDEQELTEWMCDNLIMYFIATSNFNIVEMELISHLNPPLNLKNNKSSINRDFRQLLSKLRATKN